jgi:hypothetical protein
MAATCRACYPALRKRKFGEAQNLFVLLLSVWYRFHLRRSMVERQDSCRDAEDGFSSRLFLKKLLDGGFLIASKQVR